MDEQPIDASMIENDERLVRHLAWRRVRARAQAGGFNGVLVTDFTAGQKALNVLLAEKPGVGTAPSAEETEPGKTVDG